MHSWILGWMPWKTAPAARPGGVILRRGARLLTVGSSRAAPTAPDPATLKQDAQLLREVFHVVLLREPASSREFDAFMGPIAQGGSIEGTYNGIVNSTFYHNLEERANPASPATLRVFSRELIRLEGDLPHPTDFDIDPPLSVAKVSQRFRKASLFYLKRVLANEGLKVIEAQEDLDRSVVSGRVPGSEKRVAPGGTHLALWYGEWAAALAREKVDFGIPLRNLPDPAFHRQWAAHATEDRLSWEVLNRLHRLLNAAEARGAVASGFLRKSG